MAKMIDMKAIMVKHGVQFSDADKKAVALGNLFLGGTGITSLPDGLSVGGGLDLRGTGITSLPDGLSVGGEVLTDKD